MVSTWCLYFTPKPCLVFRLGTELRQPECALNMLLHITKSISLCLSLFLSPSIFLVWLPEFQNFWNLQRQSTSRNYSCWYCHHYSESLDALMLPSLSIKSPHQFGSSSQILVSSSLSLTSYVHCSCLCVWRYSWMWRTIICSIRYKYVDCYRDGVHISV